MEHKPSVVLCHGFNVSDGGKDTTDSVTIVNTGEASASFAVFYRAL